MQAHQGRFGELGAHVLGISCDSLASHRAFADASGGIDFPLLSDFWPHGRVTREYGVLDEEHGHPRRSAFVIDRDGVIRWAYHAELGEQRDLSIILEVLEDLHDQRR